MGNVHASSFVNLFLVSVIEALYLKDKNTVNADQYSLHLIEVVNVVERLSRIVRVSVFFPNIRLDCLFDDHSS
jgi:hypothetical protein